MIKDLLIVIVSGTVGLVVLLLWYVGSHGNLRFRPHMTEDWIASAIVAASLIGLLYSAIQIVQRLRHRK